MVSVVTNTGCSNMKEKPADFDSPDRIQIRFLSFPGERWKLGGGGGFLSLALLSALSPRFAHGGSLAALIDETFSKTAYLSGEGLLTVNFNIRFKK